MLAEKTVDLSIYYYGMPLSAAMLTCACMAMSGRRCFDCGATSQDASFTGIRKPYRRRDQCEDCARDPHAAGQHRVAARLAEIAALRAAGRYFPSKPFHTAPLFAALRPRAQTEEENR